VNYPDVPLPGELQEALAALSPLCRELTVPPGTLGVILGSGLGAAADDFAPVWEYSFADLGLTGASVAGHKGRLILARSPGGHFLFLQGRIHRYEGHPDSKVLLPAAIMAGLGLRGLLITNAAGGIDPTFRAGDFMLITDILSFQLDDPLRGMTAQAPRCPPRRPLFDPELSGSLLAAAGQTGVTMHQGILNVATGPTYETRAELNMSRTMGAHAASMSTFPESLLVSHMGVPTVALSCITNEISEDPDGEPLTHEEVVEVGNRAAVDFGKLLAAWSGENHTKV
jgi:purine-nucleoside phosphorylase